MKVKGGNSPCKSCKDYVGSEINKSEAMVMFNECEDLFCTAYVLRDSILDQKEDNEDG